MTLPCIVCDQPIEGVNNGPDYTGNQPYGGTTFMGDGQYGSTIFDPMDGSYLQLNVCDPCLRKKAAAIKVCRAQRLVTLGRMGIIGCERIPYESKSWDPDDHRPFGEDRRNLDPADLIDLPEGVRLTGGLEPAALLYSLYLMERDDVGGD